MWCSLLALAAFLFTPTVIVAQRSNQNSVTSSSECGVLRENQFFNLEKRVADNEFPWMANLINKNDEFLCLCVLIDKQYALVSSPCLEFGKSRGYEFIVEVGNCRKKWQCSVKIEVEAFVDHPQYVLHNLSNGISVLRLKEPVAITDYIRPICLPSTQIAGINFAGQYLTMTGRLLPRGQSAKHVIPIVGRSRCQKTYEGLDFNQFIDGNLLCANICDNGSKYASGSALMGVSMDNTMADHYYMVGMLVSDKLTCEDTTPDIFLRIDRHVNWINETIEKLEGIL